MGDLGFGNGLGRDRRLDGLAISPDSELADGSGIVLGSRGEQRDSRLERN